jgi:molybdopterin molybdotransferase
VIEQQPQEIGVDEARSRILERFAPLPSEAIPIADALGRVLAQPVASDIDLPPFANSAMDGYALRSVDVRDASERPVRVEVAFSVQAGDEPASLSSPRTCARIMTGAPLPKGADAVIPFERVGTDGNTAIVVKEAVASGTNVRHAGEELRAGDRLLRTGTRLGPAALALLSSAGAPTVTVHKRPRVAVLATGDEIAEPGAPLSPGRIWDGNSPALIAMIDGLGATPIPLAAARDDKATLRSRLGEARRAGSDLLVTTGGVSAGDFDLVKQVLRSRGNFDEWRVKMRPGRPLAFGAIGSLPVIGLPGNPVAAFVAFVQFARPAILKMLGIASPSWLPAELPVIVRDAIDNRGGRRTFARVVVSRCADGFEAQLAGPQGSANLLTLARANGLLVIPEEIERVQPGMRLAAQMPGWKFDEL